MSNHKEKRLILFIGYYYLKKKTNGQKNYTIRLGSLFDGPKVFKM